MNDGLRNVWQEAAVAYLKQYPSICIEELKETTKTSVRIADLRA
jgi:hypothetical protein